jgi:hypothetical protein
MSGVLMTVGPDVVGSRVILLLLAAGSEVRDLVGSLVGAGEVRPRVSFIAADRDYDRGSFDAVAGCEFLDDRIRRVE